MSCVEIISHVQSSFPNSFMNPFFIPVMLPQNFLQGTKGLLMIGKGV